MQFSENKYTCIFGGGAIRGISYIGAIQALDSLGISIETIAGSSVGAIFAGLLAVGYKREEIEDIFLKVNFDLFRDIHFGFKKGFALSKGEVFLEWIREMIETKFYGENYKNGENSTVKFKDLDKNLVIITTDLTNFKCKEFSKFETPDFEVASAIRISSSMPGLMTAVHYDDAELVDGDLQKSWPLWKISNTLNASKERILEFRLEGDYDKDGKNAIDYMNTVYSCVTSIATKNIVETYGDCDKYDYVTINTGDVLIVDFNLSEDKRKELIQQGYIQTKKYFTEKLPQKKQELEQKYKILQSGISNVVSELNRKNVINAKAALGNVYMNLCETKNLIEDSFYNDIQSARYRMDNELKPSPLFRKYSVSKIKSICEDFKRIQENLDKKINELKNYQKLYNEILVV